MIRRVLRRLGILLVVLTVTSFARAQERSLVWERWDVNITDVDTAQNRFTVRELYDVRFMGAFRFGSAVIPAERLESITNPVVSVNGQGLSGSCSERPGTFCFDRTNSGEYSIIYYFPDVVVDERVRIEISYAVHGALRVYDGGDQLWWDAIPEDHFGFPILQSSVIVTLPAGFAPREGIDPVETYGARGTISVNGSMVTATAPDGVGGEEGFSVRIQYPHDPRATAPGWQSAFDERRAFEENVQPLYDLGFPLVGLIIALGGSIWVAARFSTRGRDPTVGSVVPEYLSDPPSEMSPGLVGSLLDERVDVRDIIAVIMDLARRGYLVIEEVHESGFLGIVNAKFVFKRTDKALDGLLAFEQLVLQRVFAGKDERSLESLRNRFYVSVPEIQKAMYAAIVDEGLFEQSPASVRTGWAGAGTTLLVLAFGTFFVGTGLIESTSPAILCLPISLGIFGLVMLAFGSHMPAKTAKGALEAAKWRAFRTYMGNLEDYASMQEAADRLALFVPYAIAFGMNREWLGRFRDTPVASIPPWYFPTYLGGPYRRGYVPGSPLQTDTNMGRGLPGDLARAGDGDLSMDSMSRGLAASMNSMASGLESMINSAARVMTSQPQASNSSGRWSSGGGSFSGGGSRSGGGSGGGSRGFG